VIRPCHPRRFIMLDGTARPKGATRRCAAGPRPAPDPGGPHPETSSSRGQAGSKQATPPEPGRGFRPSAGPVIRFTPAESTDKQGPVWARWILCEAAQTAKRHPDFAASYICPPRGWLTWADAARQVSPKGQPSRPSRSWRG
jgi:hypothetical protein